MKGVEKFDSDLKVVFKQTNITKEELLKYDQFFIEINIKNIKCKSSTPYKFSQIFHRNEEGS